MMAGSWFKFSARAGAGALTLVVAIGLLGCEDGYTPDLNYPSLRTDPIVTKPAGRPKQLDPPGQLEQHITHLEKEGGKLLDPVKAAGAHRETITKYLQTAFGTPAKPKVPGDEDELKAMHLDADTLALGSKLYRRHCLHCHGLTGDGRGPTGPWVNPHPRDYRLGRFKFTSSNISEGQRRARRDDIRRTIKNGIEGTSMPSFALLDDKEVDAMISYVIHLSIRGKVEVDLLNKLAEDPDVDTEEVEKFAKRYTDTNRRNWAETEKSPIEVQPPKYTFKIGAPMSEDEKKQLQESIKRGYQQFLGGQGKAGCMSCHNDFGRANDYLYDDWGTIVRPANLSAGLYRGGRRPVDLFYRIHSGINGAGMSAFAGALQPEDLWDLVNFIQALPYPMMLPDDVRSEIYREK